MITRLLYFQTKLRNILLHIEKLCIVNGIRFYLQERNHIIVQGNQTLIIIFGKQHRNASSDTILRWVKKELLAAEINITCSKLTAVEQFPAVK